MNAQQLRNSILQEAIQGRLVPQNPADEPASVLLQRIRREKERLVKEGKLKKKDLESKPIEADEIPFEIPKGWEWVKGNSLFSKMQSTKPTGDSFKYIDVDAVNNKTNTYKAKVIKTKDAPSRATRQTQKGDVLFSMVRPYLRNITLIEDDDCIASTGFYVCRAYFVNSNFLLYLMLSSYVVDGLNSYMKGDNSPSINNSDIENFLFPIPPLSEQHRIVAKIEELLPLVEQYGKAQAELEELNRTLPDKLKKSVLQEAIQGRLVPQDANDEPASELLKRIRKEKERLVKEGKLKKKDLESKPIEEDEIPFEIPKGWEWIRLGEIGIFERGSGIKRDETQEFGYPCVRYGEMYTHYRYSPTFTRTRSYTSLCVFEKCRKAHCGDIFMALTGENKQDIALAAQYLGKNEVAVGGDLCHFTVLNAVALYFVYIINSAYFSNKKEGLATGDIIVHISTDKLASIPIPLPPLSEQHRIVAKIEELFEKIDGLKR